MASVTPSILNCFREGGGVAFSHHHPDMPRVIERFTAPMFSNFLTKVWIPESMPEVHRKLSEGADVADGGCGSGLAIIEMARAYPKSRFTGFEPNSPSAFRALNAAKDAGLIDRVNIHNARSDLGTCMGEEKPRQMSDNAGFSHFRKLEFEHPLAVLYEVKV